MSERIQTYAPTLPNFGGVPLAQTQADIRALRGWAEGWNGGDVAAPQNAAIETATVWVELLYHDALRAKGLWQAPHVAASEDGAVLLEWWNGDKGLSVYIDAESVTYIKDWGPHILNEMEDGVIASAATRRQLF